LHLQVFEERLTHALGHEVRLSTPRVLVHESVAGPATVTGEALRHFGGRQVSVRIELAVEPVPGGGTAEVGDVAVENRRLEVLVRRLLTAQLRAGLSGNCPAHDLRIHVRSIGGDLEGPALEAVCGQAIAIAGRRVMVAAGIVNLEPYVACVVSCPTESLSGALADLRSPGAEIGVVNHVDGCGEVRAELPLARVLGYATRLRSLTRGLGAVHLRPLGMRPVGGEA